MLKIVATLPEQKFYQRINGRGERWQWQDIASDRLRVIAPASYDPWKAENPILVRLENGKTRKDVSFPRRLNLLILPEAQEDAIKATVVREQWFGAFAHSTCSTEAFFAFPAIGKGESWLMLSIILSKNENKPNSLHS